MATMSRVRRSHVLMLVLGLLLVPPAAFAAVSDAKGTTALADVVKVGDTVAVTPWSGGKLKGQVVDVTACSLVLRAAGESILIQAAAIKTLRRYPPRKQTPDPKAMLGAAASGQHTGYAPETLALLGVAAVFEGIHHLARKREVVYRGTRTRAARPACPAATAAARAKP